MKLCTCFSARVNSNFRARTATIVAVQETPWITREREKEKLGEYRTFQGQNANPDGPV